MPQLTPEEIAKKYGGTVSTDDIAKKYGGVVSQEEQAKQTDPQIGSKGGFFSGLWDAINPVPAVKTAANVLSYQNPMFGIQQQVAEPMGQNFASNMEQAVDAPTIAQKLRYAGQAMPIVGPGVEKAAEGDISGAIGYGVGLVGPSLLAKAVGATRLPAFLKDKAIEQYSQVLNPTTKINKNYTIKVVPEMIDRGIWSLTRKGLMGKVDDAIVSAGDHLDKVWSEQMAGTTFKKKPILDAMDDVIDQWTTTGEKTVEQPVSGAYGEALAPDKVKVQTTVVPRPEIVEQLKRIRGVIEQYASDVPSETLRKTRGIWDAVVAKAGGFGGEDLINQAKVYSQKQGANAIRETLNSNVDLAKANKELSFWLRVNDVLEAKALRNTGQATPISEKILMSGGLAHGGVMYGVAAKEAAKLLRSTGYKTISAVTKNRLARMLERGDIANFNGLVSGLLNSMPEGEEGQDRE